MNITLSEIVGQFLNSADQSTHQFRRLYNSAKFGLKTEFNLDITGVLKTEVIEVSANKTAPLPDDCIDYSKIGIKNGGGVSLLKRNDRLPMIIGAGGTGEDSIISQSQSDCFFNYTPAGYQLFGMAGGTPTYGEYTVNTSERLIYLNPDFAYTELVVEYLSDGSDCDCEEPEVPVQAGSAMLAYIRWQDAIDARKKFSTATVRQFKVDFYREKRLAKVRLNKARMSEFLAVHREGIKLVAKA